eukprot:CAMPEP_0195511102 /NCGR_PEP_ID=MMETSP0794_2-20130614/3545_1 /TAXON_ID=515487 /ORGANISM="Stephanopyxis turris, Strain CCMP 815" /LENGTH=403 /DNA_ID=CAMNT_0040638649 /DNA_START=161 /DNA_END=1372 /DNA_ORIENTATION=-
MNRIKHVFQRPPRQLSSILSKQVLLHNEEDDVSYTRSFSSNVKHKDERFGNPNYENDPTVGICKKIAFIGSGKMAEALISPLVSTNLQPSDQISVYDVSCAAMKNMNSKYGISSTSSIAECIDNADLIVCAVKPQNCELVFSEIKKCMTHKITYDTDDANERLKKEVVVRPDATLLSIVAGKPIKSFRSSGIFRIVRSMPNTPATIGKGVTVWTCTSNICTNTQDKIKTILSTFGKAIYVDDESFIDMATSISGSGPAYIFMLMEAMIDAGVHMGFNREVATTLTYHTLLGSTLYAMETGEHPAILRNSVTSPSGTTASALYELEDGKFRVVIKDAIWACYRRGLEMGGADSNVGPRRQQPLIITPPVYAAPVGEIVDENNIGTPPNANAAEDAVNVTPAGSK